MEKLYQIDGYKFIYHISNEGKIYDRYLKILKPHLDKDGYVRIRLVTIEGKRQQRFIHRLVAKYFIGHENFDNLTVNHLDGDKLNNNDWNLEIVTRAENNKHAFKTGLKDNKGEKHGKSHFKNEDIMKIREFFKNGMSQTNIAKIYNSKQARISEIVHYKSWKHI